MNVVDATLRNPMVRSVDPRDAEIERLRNRVMDLEGLLGLTEVRPSEVKGLSPAEVKVLLLLLRRDFVGRDTVRIAISPRGAECETYAATYICKLRRKLGADLRRCIQTSWGTGFFISAKDKPRIRGWLEERSK